MSINEENLNQLLGKFVADFGATFHAGLVVIGLALGAQAGEERMREIVSAGGFKYFRRTTETPFNLFFEAKPRRVGGR